MNELNNDLVLWVSIAAVVATIIALVGFGYKATRGIEGLEKDEDSSSEK